MTLVDDHLREFEGTQRRALERTVETVRAALPGAVEVLAWGMPTFRAGDETGPNIVSITGFTRHNSVFPHSGSVTETLGSALAAHQVTKGTIHFDRDRPFPAALLKKILRVRIEEINASYPKASGEFREYYDTGFAKSRGRLRNGEMTGAWQWFRRDGSLLRSGSFGTGAAAGRQVGEWVTYDRSGAPHKVTDLGRGR